MDRPTEQPRRVQVAAAVVWSGDRLLMTRRPPGGPLGLFWEFPGGKIEAGETPERALAREIAEELGVTAIPRETLAIETHDYPHGLAVEIAFIRCDLDSFDFVPGPGIHEFRWWRREELDPELALEADRPFVARLKAGAGAPSR